MKAANNVKDFFFEIVVSKAVSHGSMVQASY